MTAGSSHASRTEATASPNIDLSAFVLLRWRGSRKLQCSISQILMLVTRLAFWSSMRRAAHFSVRRGLTLTTTTLCSGSKSQVCISVPRVGKNEKSRYYYLAIREASCSQKAHKDFLGLYMTPIAKTEPSMHCSSSSSQRTLYSSSR